MSVEEMLKKIMVDQAQLVADVRNKTSYTKSEETIWAVC